MGDGNGGAVGGNAPLPRSLSASASAIQAAYRRWRARKRGKFGQGGGRDARDVEVAMREARERALWCGMLACAWFAMSTGLALFNKEILGAKRGGFPAPLFLTAMQFAIQYGLARTAIRLGMIDKAERRRGTREEVPSGVFWRALAPVGAAMGLDIALSNLSLVFITVSAYTVAKTSTIVFTLLLAFAFRFERPTWYLGAVVGMVVVGQVLSVEASSTRGGQFNSTGFFICLVAALMSALRWTLAQRVMHKDSDEPGDHARGIKDSYLVDHPVVFVYLVMPVMCGVVFTFSCIKEKWWVTIPASPWWGSIIDIFVDLIVFACGALVAFLLTLTEFELLNETSALTIMMIGVLKDVLAIVLGVIVFGDHFGFANIVGMAMCLGGVVGYNKYKLDSLKVRALTSNAPDVENDGDAVPLVDMIGSSSDGLERRQRESHRRMTNEITIYS